MQYGFAITLLELRWERTKASIEFQLGCSKWQTRSMTSRGFGILSSGVVAPLLLYCEVRGGVFRPDRVQDMRYCPYRVQTYKRMQNVHMCVSLHAPGEGRLFMTVYFPSGSPIRPMFIVIGIHMIFGGNIMSAMCSRRDALVTYAAALET